MVVRAERSTLRFLFAPWLLAGVFASACAEDPSGMDPEELDYTLASELTLAPCAALNEFCAFSGAKSVRFANGSSAVIRSFTDGVWCNAESFGVDLGAGSSCSYLERPATPMTGAMPFVDRARIPEGDDGVANAEVRLTAERAPLTEGIGAFRTRCQFSHMNFDDAIVFPGRANATHLHAYFGNTATDASSTAQSLRARGNSTCRGGTMNRSSYWVPTVLDARGTPVAPTEADIYYKTGYNGIQASAVVPFPAGLRMIAGDPRASSTQVRAYWGCHLQYIGHPGAIPACAAGDRAVMYVVFPQCWDGVNLDSTDHRSHMAYPSGGRCPSTHPVAIPEITFNVYYDVPASGTAGWRLSSDMYAPSLPGGFSAHGDYFEAWDPQVVATFVRRCLNPGLDCHSHLLGDGRMLFNSHE